MNANQAEGATPMTLDPARFLVITLGLRGAIDYADRISRNGGPLAKEYAWLAEYLTIYQAAVKVGQWPKEFER